jgi:hypothetical protein
MLDKVVAEMKADKAAATLDKVNKKGFNDRDLYCARQKEGAIDSLFATDLAAVDNEHRRANSLAVGAAAAAAILALRANDGSATVTRACCIAPADPLGPGR